MLGDPSQQSAVSKVTASLTGWHSHVSPYPVLTRDDRTLEQHGRAHSTGPSNRRRWNQTFDNVRRGTNDPSDFAGSWTSRGMGHSLALGGDMLGLDRGVDRCHCLVSLTRGNWPRVYYHRVN